MSHRSHISLQKRGLYSRLAIACIALMLLVFSLCVLGQQMPASVAASLPNSVYTKGDPNPSPSPCPSQKCHTPTPTPTPITPTPTPTPKPKPTLTPTATSTPTPGATATPTIGTTPGTTPTRGTTPTNSLTPVGPGKTTPLSGTPVLGQTPTSQSTQTTGNSTLPGSGGDNGNTPGGGSMGGLFTAAAFVLGVLAFLLYLVPQRGTSLSVLNKILSLILPVSFLRRDP